MSSEGKTVWWVGERVGWGVIGDGGGRWVWVRGLVEWPCLWFDIARNWLRIDRQSLVSASLTQREFDTQKQETQFDS